MTVSVSNQAYVFLCTVAGGMAVGLIYDLFRISRKAIKTGNLLTYFEDLLFWLIVAVVMFLTVYYSNEGELRVYIFIGAVIGAVLYAMMFSRAVMSSSMFIINIVRRIIRAICFVIAYPFRLMYGVSKAPARYIAAQSGKALRGIRRAGRNRFSKAALWKRMFRNMRKKI